ncbi:MAG TPA: transglutaminaseTgpA domain-containing protein, partial [Actinomycetota bacterium]|nr:transglutaminaseTgpA domain-containing protein [Actinomycetota bacterium]
MARRADPTPGHQRLLGLAAVAALSVATALAFGRVFAGREATLELVASALASVAIAALFERRGLLLATIASMVGLAFAITWIVLPQTAWYGLPSIQTLRAVGRSLEFVGQQARVRVAPTPPLPPLMLAAVTAVWTAAFSSHALAIRAGSPLLAILPPVALVGFADTVLEDGARPFYAIVLLAAALAVVFADGVRRVRQWGPVWSGSRTRRLGTSVRGSRPVAFAVIAAAVLVPGLLPGFRSEPLVDFSTAGDEGAGLDPFISIHAQLTDDAPVRDLFEVVTSDPQYWQTSTLDEFDGEDWRSSDPDGSKDGQTVTVPTGPLPQPQRYAPPPDTITEPFTFRILDSLNDAQALPMVQTPEQITAGDLGDVTWDPYRGQAFVDGGLDEGLEYGIVSRVVVPTAEQLDQVQELTSVQYGPWTELPADLDPRIEDIAHEWTQGEDSDYDKVLAIQQHFHTDGFRYDPDVEVADDTDALLTFLTQTKAGFCQQYATTMAVLVRELGLPARIAVGYQAGTLQDDGTYLVQSKNAHAWVEVFFEGYGWLPFEPTPGHGTHPSAEPGTYLNPVKSSTNPDGSTTNPDDPNNLGGGGGAECVAAADLSPRERQLQCQVERRPQRQPGAFVPIPSVGSTAPDGSGYSVPYRLILLGLLILLGALLIVVPIAKSAWRRRLLRRSREPREHVLAAYRVFDGEAADLGLGRREGETLDEHRARLAAAIAFTDGHLGRLTTQATRAAYAAEAPSPEEARSAVEDAHEAIRELRKDAGLVRRIV